MLSFIYMELLIGAHVSTSGGLANGLRKAKKLGVNCIQIFGSSPHQYQTRFPIEAEVAEYRKLLKAGGIKRVYLHAAYLANIASGEPRIRHASIKNLSDHLRIAEMIVADGLIFHIGSGGGKIPRQEAMKNVIAGCKEIFKNVSGKSLLIMENSAGEGNKLGSIPEEVSQMFKAVSSKRLAICLDTAHALAANTLAGNDFESVKNFLNNWDEKVGLKNIEVIHANDSKVPAGAKTDRHENIGQGFLGLEGFKNLAADKRLRSKPWILETPGFDGLGPDKKNIMVLRESFMI